MRGSEKDWSQEKAGPLKEPDPKRGLSALLRGPLGDLPLRWGQAFGLAQVEDLDESEIAGVLGVDEEPVSMYLAHAPAFQRERMAEAELEQGRGAPRVD